MKYNTYTKNIILWLSLIIVGIFFYYIWNILLHKNGNTAGKEGYINVDSTIWPLNDQDFVNNLIDIINTTTRVDLTSNANPQQINSMDMTDMLSPTTSLYINGDSTDYMPMLLNYIRVQKVDSITITLDNEATNTFTPLFYINGVNIKQRNNLFSKISGITVSTNQDTAPINNITIKSVLSTVPIMINYPYYNIQNYNITNNILSNLNQYSKIKLTMSPTAMDDVMKLLQSKSSFDIEYTFPSKPTCFALKNINPTYYKEICPQVPENALNDCSAIKNLDPQLYALSNCP